MKLGLDGSEYLSGLNKAGSATTSFSSRLKGAVAGAFSTGAILAFVGHIDDAILRVGKIAKQYKLTTEEAQRLNAAAELAGTDVESVAQALQKVMRAGEGTDINLPAGLRKFMNMSAGEVEKLRERFGVKGLELAKVFDNLQKVNIAPISDEAIENVREMNAEFSNLKQTMESLAQATAADMYTRIMKVITGKASIKDILELAGDLGNPISAPGQLLAKQGRRTPRPGEGEFIGPLPDTKLLGLDDREKVLAEDKAKFLKIQKDIQEQIFQSQLKTMKVEEKRAALEAKAQDHANKANMLAKQGKMEESAQEAKAMAEALLEINDVNLDASKKGQHDFQLTANEQAGAFIGTDPTGLGPDMQVQNAIKENTKKTAEAVQALKVIAEQNQGNNKTSGPFGSQ